MSLWRTPGPRSELHGEDLRTRRATSCATSSSSTRQPRGAGRGPHPLCTVISRADLRRCALSTERTLPTTTPHPYTERSTVELHSAPTLWNTARHGRIRSTPRHRPTAPRSVHPTPEPAEDPQS